MGQGEKEIEGSLFRQMRSAFDFLSLSNNLAATVSGFDCIEQYDYPNLPQSERSQAANVFLDGGGGFFLPFEPFLKSSLILLRYSILFPYLYTLRFVFPDILAHAA